MGLITLDLPVIGQQNTTEDPKIRNDFSLLQNLVNGNIDGANLSPGLLAQMGQVQNVLSNAPIRTVGESGNQVAGRVLTATDFTNMGLNLPLGLWNLSNVNDSSGSGRNLVNKGAVTFASGITGSASEAAQFTGSTGQALYIADTGGSDPFRIKTGSFGCWFRTAKRGVVQIALSKWGTANQNAWAFYVNAANQVECGVSTTGITQFVGATGSTDVCDDRWHFGVITIDATKVRIYVDGALDGQFVFAATLFGGAAPLNVGASAADGAAAAAGPHYGRVDEAFVTGDVLSEEQIRNLYCLSIAHTLGTPPSDVRLNIRRRRRGVALAITDFPSTPVRLYNFTGGALTDQGSNSAPLTAPGGGTVADVAGADGSVAGAKSLAGAHTGYTATDTGLPTGLAQISYGVWFKTGAQATPMTLMSWGTAGVNDLRLDIATAQGLRAINIADVITSANSVADGLWHFAVTVNDNTASDLVKRKLYMDGRIIGGSTVYNTVNAPGGTFHIGAAPNGTLPMVGQLDGAFVYAGVLTAEQVRVLYNVGSPALATSPKDQSDHIEAFEATRILGIFDTLEGSDSMDLIVVA